MFMQLRQRRSLRSNKVVVGAVAFEGEGKGQEKTPILHNSALESLL